MNICSRTLLRILIFSTTLVCGVGLLPFHRAYAQNIVQLQPIKDQAAVYKKPDFDAKILYLLPKDKKVLGTRSTVEGLQGLGLFHKVKLSDKVYGYMLDTEVRMTKSKNTEKKSPKIKPLRDKDVSLKDSSKAKASKDELLVDNSEVTQDQISKDPEKYSFYPNRFKGQKKSKPNSQPLIFSRLIGAQLGLVNYSEKTSGGTKSSNEIVYGLKLTGTNLLLRNFWLDLGVNFHFGAPEFFNDFSTEASGYFILIDATMPFVLSRSRSRYIYGGVGPLLNINVFDFTLNGQPESSQKIRLGGVGTLGLAYDLSSNWALKVEGKYYFESASYWGVLAGLQKRF